MSTAKDIFAELLPDAAVKEVQVDIAGKLWVIHLYAQKPLADTMLARVKQHLFELVPELEKIEFTVIKRLSEQEITGQLPDIWAKLVTDLAAQAPAVNGWLADAQYTYQDAVLNISLKNELGLKIMQQRGLVKQAQDIFFSYTGVIPEINLTCSPQTTDRDLAEWQSKAEEEFIKQMINNSKPQVDVNKEEKSTPAETGVFIGHSIKDEPQPLSSVQEEERQVVVEGRVFATELRELRSGRYLLTFNITDNTDSITVKNFIEKDKLETAERIQKGMWLKVRGPVQFDNYTRELTLMAYDINQVTPPERRDTAAEKRVELHLHTKMSAMDSVLGVKEAVEQAAKWGHPALAITDHGVVQAFPEAYSAGKKAGIKVIYGVEGYLIDDGVPIVENAGEEALDEAEFVVVDLETTGLHAHTEEIIEIGAVKMRGNRVVDRYSTFVRPSKPIPAQIVKLTGITDEMVKDAPSAAEALERFHQFAGQAVLVAHNASFDVGFLRVHYAKELGQTVDNAVLDTVTLARQLYPELKNHKLNTLCAEFKVPLENHHRAVDDANATAELLKIFLAECSKRGKLTVAALNELSGNGNLDKVRPNHVTILAKTQAGLKNLYKLISFSHLKYYHRHPRIPKSLLSRYREGLLIGSACEAGELFQALLAGRPHEELKKIAAFYDYLEIQPLGNSEFLVHSGRLPSMEHLKNIYQTIWQLGKELNKPVVATGDVHFLNPEDEIYRRILMSGQGYSDADRQPPLYFKTTDEMLADFAYLGERQAYQAVVVNPNKIAAQIEDIKPVPSETYSPKIEGAEQQIREMSYQTAQQLYGSPLPELVEKRLEKELNSIIGNGFAVLYLIAHKLVKKSVEDGYLVGSRGSVGSSLVATLTGITEVNPLPPHYRCPQCKYSEFITDGRYGCGADMPDKACPRCGSKLAKDGHNIPFETFLGFEGDKVPDIDLNFSGEYQSRAHKYTEELFGKDNVFRAGTIGTIAEKTAYGFVKKYFDEKGIVKREAEINRLVAGCTNVKRTTGQHPGGVMVVPKDVDVHDVTPLQYPAGDKSSGVITTHFDYHSIQDCLVKLDILGHDDPTVIKMLEDLTGVNAKEIPMDDPATLSLFSSTEALGVTKEEIRSEVGTYAIPEFGTKFVRQMLVDTKPASFSELVRISGFSHGTDVWLNNAQDLIRSGTCQLSEAISARDDIMVYLMQKGVEPRLAFKIMEKVRKGKGVSPEEEEVMLKHGVPEWYIESCRKIKYMFPKAHATAYVMMAFRIAWFKVNYPEAFYATYFTVRADDFDADLIVNGKQAVLKKIEEIEQKGNNATAKEKNLLTILEVALEMYCRGIGFYRVSLKESDATKFLIVDGNLLPPLASLQGLGEAAARNIVQAREEAAFTSIEDLRKRAKVSKTVIEILQRHGCLNGMNETDQLSLFL